MSITCRKQNIKKPIVSEIYDNEHRQIFLGESGRAKKLQTYMISDIDFFATNILFSLYLMKYFFLQISLIIYTVNFRKNVLDRCCRETNREVSGLTGDISFGMIDIIPYAI